MRIYTTKEGDRWDLISYSMYGESDRYKEIIRANPQLPEAVTLSPLLPEHITLFIPDLEEETAGGGVPWRKQ